MKRAAFVISLDFELFWGLRDHRRLEEAGPRLLGVREAIPALLSLFHRRQIRATWATVGFLFCETREEVLATLPRRLPAYANHRLSPYAHIAQIGENEEDDPYHFASSLIDTIAATPGQEIGSHTHSHYYCLEAGQTVDDFEADLAANLQVARRRGIILRSLVFPRNQVSREYLEVCRRLGFTAYRGTPNLWPYRPHRGPTSLPTRLARGVDSVIPLTGPRCIGRPDLFARRPLNVPATRFLRPFRPPTLAALQVRRIKAEIDLAVHQQGLYHLWWHPHNFGENLTANLAALESILDRVDGWRRLGRMDSLTMHEVVSGREDKEEKHPRKPRRPDRDRFASRGHR